jgi:hypothetical protein
MKDIAILLQSRNRPTEFKNIVSMLYETCSSEDNFDIVAFIDDDQIYMYDYIKDIYPNIIWIYPEHQSNSWYNLITSQHSFVKENDYYFIWTLIDDFWGLSKDWDTAIINKKYYFKDDIFTMHQSKDSYHGRFQWIFNNSYIIDNMNDGVSIYAHCELLPIHTKKWIELISPVFKNGNYTSQQELISASLILLLKKIFNINRLVKCDLSWEDGTDQGSSNSIINSNGEDRRTSFFRLASDWFDLEPILEKILTQIKNE